MHFKNRGVPDVYSDFSYVLSLQTTSWKNVTKCFKLFLFLENKQFKGRSHSN